MNSNLVLEAGITLSKELIARGADVYLGLVPEIPEKEKTGADDFIVEFGTYLFRKWVDSLKPFSHPELYRLDILLFQVPADTPRERIAFALKPLIKKAAGLDVGLGEQYLATRVKDYFNLTTKDIENLGKMLKEARKKRGKEPKTHETSEISFYKDQEFIVELISDDGNTSFIVYSLDKGEASVASQLSVGNKLYFPIKSNSIKRTSISLDSTVDEQGVVIIPRGVEEYGTEADLLKDIRSFINRFVELGKEYESIAAYYILFSWVYDRFPELPYLRYIGDWGTGKSRALIVIGSLCYRPIFTFGATTISPIFRLLEQFRGTLIIDEGDHKDSDTWRDFVKVMNVGFQNHFPLLRTEEKGGKREPKSFYVYGPKLITTRYAFKDQALESRCITKVMTPNSRRPEIPINLPDDFFMQVDKLQRKLLLFRLRNHSIVTLNPSNYDRNLEDRYNQVLIPLLSVIKDDEVISQIKSQIFELQERAVEARSDSFDGKILKALVIEIEETNESKPFIKKITKRAKPILGEDIKLSSKRVGSVLRSMGLQTKQDPSTKNYYVIVDMDRLKGLERRYGITEDEGLE